MVAIEYLNELNRKGNFPNQIGVQSENFWNGGKVNLGAKLWGARGVVSKNMGGGAIIRWVEANEGDSVWINVAKIVLGAEVRPEENRDRKQPASMLLLCAGLSSEPFTVCFMWSP